MGWYENSLFGPIADDIARVAPPGAAVIEVGCGSGALSVGLAVQHGLAVTAVDVDPGEIRRAREKAARALSAGRSRPEFLVADVARMPFDDASFDLVVSTFSMHHWDDKQAGLAEIWRVLRPGALALIWDTRRGFSLFHLRSPDPLDGVDASPLELRDVREWAWPFGLTFFRRLELARGLSNRHRWSPPDVPRRFAQVDVFSDTPYLGNPLAVVLDGDGLTSDRMQRFAAWTNLSETTFVVPATDAAADYAVRIFDTASELPFAGHPTLGTCHAWLAAGGRPRNGEWIVQECGAGLVSVRRTADGLAFRSPDPFRTGPVNEALVRRIAEVLRIEREAIVDAQWAANGPNWVVALLESADVVLALAPGFVDFDLGVVGPYPTGSPEAFEVRAFFAKDGQTAEDPVTGSLNGALAEWLVRTGRATLPYVAGQGRALGRAGRVHLSADDDGAIWVAGATVTCVTGEVDL